jgi:hypothetical protein
MLNNYISAITTMGITALTILWYRRGRLWSLYYSIISQSLVQIKLRSIDRKAWDKIAYNILEVLVKRSFPALFEFEIEYLRYKIIQNKDLLWTSDSSTTNEKEVTYTDKEKYCVYKLKNLFFNEFTFGGAGLFINSIKYRFTKGKTDPGYIEKIS